MLSRVYDTVQGAEKNHSAKTTQFLNGHELSLAQRALAKSCCVCFSAYGGFDDAERQVIAFYPDGVPPDWHLSVIKTSGRDIEALSHRDYLGGILALGIKRDAVGDIVIGEGCGFIICKTEIAEYIVSELKRIGNQPVSLSLCGFSEINRLPKKFREIRTTLSSLRLDAFLGAGLGVSRSDAAALVKSGRVSVDWAPSDSVSRTVAEGQTVSVKGHGRLELFGIKGETKKGRLAVVIRRY